MIQKKKPSVFLCGLILPLILICICASTQAFGQTIVSFPTEDGWKIYGSLYLPERQDGALGPAVILLSEPGWVDRSIYDTYLARKLSKLGIAALSIDLRGTGASVGVKDYEAFSPRDLQGLQMDLRGAVKFLSSQKGVDIGRVGIVGAGSSGDFAVLEASENPGVRAIVLISGSLGPAAQAYIKSRNDLPLLSVMGRKDQVVSERDLAEPYFLSSNPESDLIVAAGHGTTMLMVTASLEGQVVQWLEKRLNVPGSGREREVSFQSQDGWTLQGTLRIPAGVTAGQKIPGVVLVHGARHDQRTYHNLAQEVVRSGMAVLTFDWRGKGRSIKAGKGVFGVNLSDEEANKVYLDIKAATEFLAKQPGVDPSRIGLLAATLSCKYTLQAAIGDPRVKTIILLSYSDVIKETELTPEAKQFLTTSDAPILAVATTGDRHITFGYPAEFTRKAYATSKSKYSQFFLYDGTGHGSEMLKENRQLQPMVLRWLKEKLTGESELK